MNGRHGLNDRERPFALFRIKRSLSKVLNQDTMQKMELGCEWR